MCGLRVEVRMCESTLEFGRHGRDREQGGGHARAERFASKAAATRAEARFGVAIDAIVLHVVLSTFDEIDIKFYTPPSAAPVAIAHAPLSNQTT